MDSYRWVYINVHIYDTYFPSIIADSINRTLRFNYDGLGNVIIQKHIVTKKLCQIAKFKHRKAH